METNSDNSGRVTPDSARSAPDSLADSRARAATQVATPWWYHVSLGATLALVFLAMSLRVASWAGAVLVLVVFGLGYVLRRATGVSYERYTSTPGAIRVYGGYVLALVLLAAVGMYLEWGAGVHWAIAVAGGVIGVLTVAVEFRLDAIARRDIRAGR